MKVFGLTILLFSVNVYALDCDNATSTVDMNTCAKQVQEKTEKELNVVYKKVMESLSRPDTEYDKPSEAKAALRNAQRAWIKFREADCKAVYIQNQGGTIRTLAHLNCMQSRAEQRIKELNDFIPSY